MSERWQPYPNHGQVRALTERIGELEDMIMQEARVPGDQPPLGRLLAERTVLG